MRRLFRFGGVIFAMLAVALVAGAAVVRVVRERSANAERVTRTFDKRYMERDRIARPGNAATVVGNRGEAPGENEGTDSEPSPASAEEERYMARAYPAGTISVAQVRRAQQTWTSFRENKEATGPNNRNHPFRWDLIGPIHATMPGVLTFSGAQYREAGRTTAMAITPTCTNSRCTLWIGAAGGGIWRTDNPLSPDPSWFFVSGSFGINAIGTLDQDPNDPSGMTLYAGTGEPNASGDSEAGVGIFKTTNGGATWTLLPGSELFTTRAIGKIAVVPGQPNHIYVAVARGIRGYSSVTGGAISRTAGPLDGPDQAPLGLWESTDGGTTFTLAWDGAGSIRGANDVGLDPQNPNVVYAAAFQSGIWRRDPTKGETTFQKVFSTGKPAENTSRTQFDLTLKDGHTRIYASDGSLGPVFAPDPGGGQTEVADSASGVWRVDNADTFTAGALLATQASPRDGVGWDRKTSATERPRAAIGRESYEFCTGQCWYDSDIVTPKDQTATGVVYYPDIAYLLGSYNYSELRGPSNARAVLLSTSAADPDPTCRGCTFSDLTWDNTPENQPDQTHPDIHELVTMPGNPLMYFVGSDGGVIRNDGTFDDNSDECLDRPLGADSLVLCQKLLSRVPHQLFDTMNKGLSTLQFQSVAIDPKRPNRVQGGTQDNGTLEWTGSAMQWENVIYGDGGNGGYDYCDSKIRFNTFFTQATDSNFRDGHPTDWVVTSGPLFAPQNAGEVSSFYGPIVADYTNCGRKADFPQFQTEAARLANANTFAGRPGVPATPPEGQQIGAQLGFKYIGLNHVWRTIDNGGPQGYLEANCPEFFTSAADPRCGDWKSLGGPPGANQPGGLTGTSYGGDRLGGTVVAIQRSRSDSISLWAATSTGRLFVTRNVNAVDPNAVVFCRLDDKALNDPPRFISSIHPDPGNSNRAFVSYNGYNSATKDQPGHVFEVTLSEPTGCAGPVTWRDLLVEQGSIPEGREGDIPIVDLVQDDLKGDLYASTDFGVLRGEKVTPSPAVPAGYAWARVGEGLPRVETPGITIDSCARILYAATHGRSVWRMFLPPVANAPKTQSCPTTP
jgi:hypothetical protein